MPGTEFSHLYTISNLIPPQPYDINIITGNLLRRNLRPGERHYVIYSRSYNLTG